MTFISVIVPVYNAEKYLRQCINSLLTQTMRDIEIICVNDGSTDNSLDILKEFASCDSRVKIISKHNSGYGDSMNIGLKNAKGEYIGIVESDDYTHTDMFSNLFYEAKMKDVDVVKSNYYSISEKKGENYEEILAGIPYHTVFSPNDNMKIWDITPSIWSGLYKKEFLEKQRISFHTSPGASYQDVSFWYKVLLSTEKIVCVPEAYLCYRSDNENSSVKSPKKVFCIMDEFEEIKKYIEEKHLETMMPIILKEQFIHYIGNYFRIDSLYQYAFLERMKEELRQDYESGLMDYSFWTTENWNLLQQILRDSDYFFESTNIDYINKYRNKEYTINHNLSHIGAKKILIDTEKIIIYGAGIYGQRLLNNFSDKRKIIAFAVTKLMDGISDKIEGIPICEIDDLKEYNTKSVVIVAMKKSNQFPVLKKLKELGFNKVISVDKA